MLDSQNLELKAAGFYLNNQNQEPRGTKSVGPVRATQAAHVGSHGKPVDNYDKIMTGDKMANKTGYHFNILQAPAKRVSDVATTLNMRAPANMMSNSASKGEDNTTNTVFYPKVQASHVSPKPTSDSQLEAQGK